MINAARHLGLIVHFEQMLDCNVYLWGDQVEVRPAGQRFEVTFWTTRAVATAGVLLSRRVQQGARLRPAVEANRKEAVTLCLVIDGCLVIDDRYTEAFDWELTPRSKRDLEFISLGGTAPRRHAFTLTATSVTEQTPRSQPSQNNQQDRDKVQAVDSSESQQSQSLLFSPPGPSPGPGSGSEQEPARRKSSRSKRAKQRSE